jgi:hypothetical protein
MAKRMDTSERTDLRMTWEAYRDNALEQLGNHCRGGNVLTAEARARGKKAEDIFQGPWHHWATLITEDAREWFDANPRLTWTDFMRDMKPQGVDMRSAEKGAAAVRNLEQLRLDLGMRAQWLIDAREAGITWPALEEATGMTRVALNNLVKKHTGGKLP